MDQVFTWPELSLHDQNCLYMARTGYMYMTRSGYTYMATNVYKWTKLPIQNCISWTEPCLYINTEPQNNLY